MSRLTRGLLPVLLLCTTVTVTGCGAATPRPPSAAPAAPAPTAQQQGADALLASLPLPPGAHRLAAAPTGVQPVLTGAPLALPPGDSAVAVGWWLSPLSLQGTGAWLSGLKDFSVQERGNAFRTVGREWPGSGGWGARYAEIAAFSAHGTVYLEALAQAELLGPRPKASLIPAGGTTVDVTIRTPGAVRHTRITDRARITRAVALLNALSLGSGAKRNCPVDTGGAVELDFAPGHRVLLQLSGCRGITVEALGLPADGTGLDADGDRSDAVLHALGLSVTGTSVAR